MMLENVSPSWNDSLRFIMNKESGGRIGIHNRSSSARGLFQLTAANHHLNPNGAASFGNGVEEAQGRIRYIKQRYGTDDQAMEHWQQNGWY
jgi:SLT domain-containing protein